MTQPPEEGIRITRPLRDVEEFWVVPKVAALQLTVSLS